MNLPTTRSELLASGACKIVEASSESPGKSVWTRLSLWWIEDEDRPYIAVVEGLTSRADLEDRFRAHAFGSVSRAIAWFEASELRDLLMTQLPMDLPTAFPDANTLRQRRAQATRGFRGAGIVDAIGWLYDDVADEGVTVRAKRVEQDFGVPWRTVTNALNGENVRGWGAGFVAALRFFDRGAWRAARRAESERTHDATSAIDDCEFPAPYGRHQDGRPRELDECD